MYLKVVPNIIITKKIYLFNYEENDTADKDKWEVDYDEEVGNCFGAIEYEEEFDHYKENPMSIVGEVHAEVEYQAGKFALISKDKIDAMNMDD